MDTSKSPSPGVERGDDDELKRLYMVALSDMERLLDPKYEWRDDEAIRIDDMIVQFRIWGIELDIQSGTLRWLQDEYLREARAIQVNLRAVQSSLTRLVSHVSGEIEARVVVKTETINTADVARRETHLTLLDDFARCVAEFCDLSESFQIVISLHNKQGPAARVKKFMDVSKTASDDIGTSVTSVTTAQDSTTTLDSDHVESGATTRDTSIIEGPIPFFGDKGKQTELSPGKTNIYDPDFEAEVGPEHSDSRGEASVASPRPSKMIPESLTIFTTSISILNLLRNGVASVYTDIQDYKSYPSFYELLGNKLKGLRTSLEKWQRRWMIWSADEELFKFFWSVGCEDVLAQLRRIEHQLKQLDIMLRDCDTHGRGKAARVTKKIFNTVIRKLDHTERQISRIKNSVDELTTAADAAFCSIRTRHDRADDSPWLTPEIHMVGYKHLLVRIAWDSYKASNELHGNCHQARSELTMQLELNFFGTDVKEKDLLPPSIAASAMQNSERSSTRFEAVAKSAVNATNPTVKPQNLTSNPEKTVVNTALRYTFLSKDLKDPQLWVRMRATPAKLDKRDEYKMTFSAAQRLVAARDRERDRCGLEFSPNGTLAVVREELGDIKGDIPEPVSLRTVLGTARKENDEGLLKTLRIRRAFEIVEFGMLFLKTSWIHCICSCNVSEVKVNINCNETSGKEDYRYTLKIPPLKHVLYLNGDSDDGPAGQHDSLTSCWCVNKLHGDPSIATKFQAYPLFYIGLFLVEVALDALIINIEIEGGGIVKPNLLKLTYTNPDSGANQPIQKTLRELEVELGGEYYNATVTCLTSTWTSQSIEQDELRIYFTKVLYPIYILYHNIANANRIAAAWELK